MDDKMLLCQILVDEESLESYFLGKYDGVDVSFQSYIEVSPERREDLKRILDELTWLLVGELARNITERNLSDTLN